ncbi:phosphonoacetaldehyde hydrolase [Alienimonas chondri]|uniref:Phosphonoacetaldehyde hydrolase n=1 Tax=Alienimonas chondri TaxID=2681879 RepID=A0ABX1V7D6_9PLAN|nr:phosphonoacetaldehyde hydrolase [Alienimonas chondri]NNJ24120.1 Phosphonoacetaldehyde hydrolase [Alienimonas chondri]
MTDSPALPAAVASELSAVVFDWAGTMIDFGSRAPVEVFRAVFESSGVPVTEAQARGPMGAAKRDHIAALLALDDVKTRWADKQGSEPTDAEIDRLYKEFLPLQKEVLGRHCEPIPGVVELLQALSEAGVPIGSTTGYNRDLMSVVLPLAKAAGVAPNAAVCSDDVPAGRPRPWMLLEALKRMDAAPIWRAVKVDDTPMGVEAARNAGCWGVGLSASGNALGVSLAEWNKMPAAERTAALTPIEATFRDAGAHYVIPTAADLPPVLTEIASRLAAGERP